MLRVDLADGRAVGAADVVGLDLEAGDRRRLRIGREQQVAVLLIGVGLLRAPVDADDPAPDGPERSSSTPLNARSDIVSGAACSWVVS